MEHKVHLLKSETTEVVLCGCVTWSPRDEYYAPLTTVRHRLLPRVFGRRVQPTDIASHAQTLKIVGWQSVRAFVGQRRLCFAGGMVRQSEERLPKRLMTLAGGALNGTGRVATIQVFERC